MADSILLPLIRRLSIATKSAGVTHLEPNWAQLIVLEELEAALREHRMFRGITLKARQLGISTIIEAYIYVMSFVLSNQRSAVIADEVDNATHLLSMTDLFWETDPFRILYATKYQARNTIHWVTTADTALDNDDSLPGNSSVRTMTAGNKKAGRSRTIQQLHASEVAFWLEPEKVMTGLLQAVPTLPQTMVMLESTANGVGNYFHSTWTQAILHETEYVPLFFPWWMHPEYRASYLRLPPRDLGHLDEEERNLQVLFKVGLTVGNRHFSLDPAHWDDALAWRRYSIRNECRNDIKVFHQEYPSTPEEAFIATGTNVFPIQHLQACFKEETGQSGRLHMNGNTVTHQKDIAGPLKVFRLPAPNVDYGIYSIGGDATATMHGDYACAQVINRRSLEQVAVWRGRIDPAHFATELTKLGAWYNWALLAPENEGPGFSTIGALQVLDYPNLYMPEMPENLPGRYVGKFGFSSSYKTKEEAIGWLLKLVVDHDLTIHDRVTFGEMVNYVTLEGGGYGAAGGDKNHDDTVMALAIAVLASMKQGPMMPYGTLGSTETGLRVVAEMPTWAEVG